MGVSLAVLSIVFGLTGMAMALVVTSVVGLQVYRYALLAGAWLGLGGAWFALMARTSALCARPEMPCGATPPDTTWLLVMALAVALAGCLIGLANLRSSPPA